MSTRGEDGIYLHIGVPKTGTTYVQNVLWANRDRLATQGVLLAADRISDHYRAVVELQGGSFGGYEVSGAQGAWGRVADKAVSWPGRSLISHEMFAGLRDGKVEEVLESIGSRPVHVVLTVRDLAKIVPASWQETAKNQRVEPWHDYVDRIKVLDRGKRDRFWRLQNVSRILGVWARFVPAERIHVVTVPPPGAPRSLLIERLCSVLGVDSRGFDLDVPRTNESIGVAEVALLHRINLVAAGRMSWPAYHDYLKHFAVPKFLATRAESARITLPDSELPWLRQESEHTRATIARLGCDVVGDLDELTPRTGGADYVDPSSVPDDEVLQAAVDLLIGMVEEYAALDHRTKAATVVRQMLGGLRARRWSEVRELGGRLRDLRRRRSIPG